MRILRKEFYGTREVIWMTNEYQLDYVVNRKRNADIYTDGIDTEPITLGSGRDIIKYLLNDDLDLADWKLVKRKGK